MKNIKREIGLRIKNLRKEAGYTQAQLSEIIEINEKNLSNIERGVNGMTMDTVIKLCKALNASADYILFGENIAHANTPLQKKIAELSPHQQMYAEQFIELYVKACKGR